MLRHEILLAVDTNKKDICEGVAAFATAVVLGEFSPIISASGKKIINLRTAISYEFRNPKIEPEKLGWMYAIKNFQLASLKGKPRSVGMLVDHDLDALKSINSRLQEISPGFFLPPEFRMIYASSEVGSDSIANTLIWAADREAKRVLQSIALKPNDMTAFLTPEHGLCDLVRAITPINASYHTLEEVRIAMGKEQPRPIRT